MKQMQFSKLIGQTRNQSVALHVVKKNGLIRLLDCSIRT